MLPYLLGELPAAVVFTLSPLELHVPPCWSKIRSNRAQASSALKRNPHPPKTQKLQRKKCEPQSLNTNQFKVLSVCYCILINNYLFSVI